MAVSPPYATTGDVEASLGTAEYTALADRDNDGSPDTSDVEAALLRASSEADAYLSRYLPLSSLPTWLVGAVADIAAYRFAGSRASEDARKKFEDAVRLLEKIQAGKAGVGLAPPADDLDDDILAEGAVQVMTRQSLGRIM